METKTHYFTSPGKVNTQVTLDLAYRRAQELGIKKVVVATSTGETAAAAVKYMKGLGVIAVTHSAGFQAANAQELKDEFKSRIEVGGGKVFTATHAFGGIGRAVRKKLNTYELDEIIAFALRTVGQGFKVACEITVMAADAGLVRTDEEIIAIGGTGYGADTAVVLKPTHTQTFFDLQVLEIICKPRYPAKK